MLEKLKDRYNIVIVILAIIFMIMTFRLATLTIVHGEEYRKISDSKRVKEIPISARRGNIVDRYGRILAGTKPSFTVQVMKDELDKDKFNDTALKLMTLLEEEGEGYVDEFPIELNRFEYSQLDDFIKNDEKIEDKIVRLLVENDLIGNLLNRKYIHKTDHYKFDYIIAKEFITILENEGIQVPIKINLDDKDNVIFSYINDVDIIKWKKTNGISVNANPKDVLLHFINDDKVIINKVLGNSIVREITYELLKEKDLIDNYELKPYVFKSDREVKLIKKDLINKEFKNITMISTAKDDFINIALDDRDEYKFVDKLFEKAYKSGSEDNQKIIVPGEKLLEKFKENKIDIPIIINVNEDDTVEYKYRDEESKKIFLTREEMKDNSTAQEALMKIGKKTGFIDEVIVDEDVKRIMQQIILKEINPKISVSKWEYVAELNKESWFNKSTYKIPEESSAEEAFNYLKTRFSVSAENDKYETRHILLFKETVEKQGYRAYEPINISSDVKDKTVAKLSENNLELPGVKVSVEYIRYYPMGTTAAHILGYLGKISQSYEIDKYINELGYSRNDTIGKIGIEDTFEEYLNGIDGSKKVEVDALGNTIQTLEEHKATPGDDLFLTIDIELQQVAEKALKHALEEIQVGGEFESAWGNYNYKKTFKNATSGSVVAIDVKTGEVLALANYPAYDPNLFVPYISATDWDSLKPEHEKDVLAPKPLYNIALQTAVQPGSTFKMITALAALEKGIDPNEKISTKGYVTIGNQKFGCWIYNDYNRTHGAENLYDALRDSCNYYFYTLTLDNSQRRTGMNLGDNIEKEDIIRVAKEFGLGDKTGIEIRGEAAGNVPNPTDGVISIKRTLRSFLNNNIKYYIKEDATVDDEKTDEIIEEIVEWVNLENILTRGEVFRRLEKLDINPNKKREGETPIVDIIKYDYLNQASWKTSDTLITAIGQGKNSYTPIQMANFLAILANDGIKNKVSVVSKVQSFDGNEVTFVPDRESEKINLNDLGNIEHVKIGMEMVTGIGGTAYSHFKNFPVKVGAKTGTAENDGVNAVTKEEYDNFAWFVAYAPADDPQIAVATLIFQGGSGGYAAPVAKEVIAQYLGLNNKSEEIILKNEIVR